MEGTIKARECVCYDYTYVRYRARKQPLFLEKRERGKLPKEISVT